MASNTETAYSKVVIDSGQAEASLKALRAEAKKMKAELDQMKLSKDPGFEKKKREYSELNSRIDEAKRSTTDLARIMRNLNGTSLKDLTKAQRQLAAEIRNSSRDTKEEIAALKVKTEQYRKLSAEINKVKGSMSGQSTGVLDSMAHGFNKFFTMGTAAVAMFTGVAFSVKNMIQGNAELSDSLSDVAKTTGLTTKEVRELYTELGKIDTRTSRKDLLDLAYAAGKLGYSGKSEIVGFVKAADQIGVALSKDLGGNVEESVTSLGKLVDLFKVNKSFTIEESLLKTGSAINALGAAGTANEAYIVDFTTRLAGIAPQAGLSIEQVMGLGATLDQLGQQSETSGTAVTQLLVKMFSKPAEYAKIAGESVGAFTRLVKTDANAALIKLLEGLQKNQGGLTELAANFKDLGVDGQRSISVIGALANNVDMLKTSQALSNVEFQKGTSLTREFNLKNENMAGNMERIGKALRSYFVNGALMSGLSGIVSEIAEWTKTPLAETLEQDRQKVNLLTNRLMDANLQAETRNKLYKELNGIAPNVLNGINSEAIAYDTLRKNLAAYNREAIKKIAIANQDEIVGKSQKKAAEWFTKRESLEDQLRTIMINSTEIIRKFDANLANELDKTVTSAYLNVGQKYRLFWKEIDKQGNKPSVALVQLGRSRNNYVYNEYQRAMGEEDAATKEANEQMKVSNRMSEQLAQTINATTDAISTETTVTNENTTTKDKNTEKTKQLKTAYEELTDKVQKLDSGINDALASGNLPLAQKLIIEKKAADELIKNLEIIREGLAKGYTWPSQVQTGPPNYVYNMVPKKAGTIVSTDKRSRIGLRDTSKEREDNSGMIRAQKEVMDEDAAIREAKFAAASSLNNALWDITRNRQQGEYDHAISLIEKQRERELSNKLLTEEQKQAINEKYDAKARKLKKEAFKKQQHANELQALMNGALAITKTFAEYGFTPAGWAAAIAQGVATAAEIAVIATQPVPEYAQGRYNVTGMSGTRYSADYAGPAVTGIYTRPAIVAESGSEMIVDNRTLRNLQQNFPGIIDAIRMARIPQYAGGRYTSTATAPVPQSSANMGDMARAISELVALNREMQRTGLRANISLYDLDKFRQKRDTIDQDSVL